jgi:hypothetical protein
VALNITGEIRPLKYYIERSIDGLKWFRGGSKGWRIQYLIDSQPFGGKSTTGRLSGLNGTLKYFEPIYVDLESAEPVWSSRTQSLTIKSMRLYVEISNPSRLSSFDTMLKNGSCGEKY